MLLDMIFITSYSLSHKNFHVKRQSATRVSEGLLINNWFSNSHSQKTVPLKLKNKPSSSEEHASMFILLYLLLTFVSRSLPASYLSVLPHSFSPKQVRLDILWQRTGWEQERTKALKIHKWTLTQTHITKGFVPKTKTSKSYFELQLLDPAYSHRTSHLLACSNSTNPLQLFYCIAIRNILPLFKDW